MRYGIVGQTGTRPPSTPEYPGRSETLNCVVEGRGEFWSSVEWGLAGLQDDIREVKMGLCLSLSRLSYHTSRKSAHFTP